MNRILVIPKGLGNSFICDSMSEVRKKLGVGPNAVRRAISKGTSVKSGNREYFLDYPLEDDDDEVVFTPKRHGTPKYELTSQLDDSIYQFNSCEEMAAFCSRSTEFIHNHKEDGALLESGRGTFYKLRVIA